MTAANENIDGYERRRRDIQNRIITVTSEMIRNRGDTKIPTRAIAELAGVSQATPFNHFKSKDGILAAIVEASFLAVPNPKGNSKQLAALNGLLNISKLYISDEALYRPLFKSVLTRVSNSPTLRSAFETLESRLIEDQKRGLISPGVDLQLMAEQLETFWLGSAALWSNGTISSEAWLLRIEHGVYAMLSFVMPEKTRISKRKFRDLESAIRNQAGR